MVGSTSDLAREYAEKARGKGLGDDGRREPLLIVADRQTTGRGRGAKRWWTGQGSLAFSLLLPPDMIREDRARPSLVGLAVGVAVAEAVAPIVSETGNKAAVHWPNDVYIGNRKLAGILVEVLPDRRHIVGIGINTNNSTQAAPDELQRRVVTLRDLVGRELEHAEVLVGLLGNLERQLGDLAESPSKIARRANGLCGQTGRDLSLKMGTEVYSGRCRGIADDGGLVLETSNGRQTFHSGTLH